MNALTLASTTLQGPSVDWHALSPFLVLTVGAIVVLVAGLVGSERARSISVPVITLAALVATGVLLVGNWSAEPVTIVSGALSLDQLTIGLSLICIVQAAAAVLLSLRRVNEATIGRGEYHGLVLFTLLGMLLLIAASDLVTLFAALELLSISLYVLCASQIRRERSLEAGLKYLIIGSVGSATLLYGLAMVYGATGSTSFETIAIVTDQTGGILGDPLMLAGIAFAVAGLAFKASAAPFHQWTPDVYEGAPTAITTFMATATKVAAFAILIRMFAGPLVPAWHEWGPLLAIIATLSIIVGNAGALGQDSLKRMLAWSSIAQAGYLLAGLVVATSLGVSALVFYLAVYVVITLSAFAVVLVVQSDEQGDDRIESFSGLGRRRPLLAGAMTVAMLSLAGLPPTGGFIGKVSLIGADVSGGYTWLAVVIVLGSLVSLGYYLKVIAAMWMSGDVADSAPRSRSRVPEIVVIAVVAAAVGLGAGIAPDWGLDRSADMSRPVARR